MGFKHINAVLKYSHTAGPDRAIILALACRANEAGECWPGLTRLARDSGLSRRTVTRRLPCIEALGELRISRRGKRGPTKGGEQVSNLYKILIAPAEGRDGPTPPLAQKVGTDGPKGRDPQSPKVGTDGPKGRDSLTPKQSEKDHYEPSENRQEPKPAGLTESMIDFSKAKPPEIEDCPEIYNPQHHPVIVAMAVTGERGKQGWGHWAKVFNRAKKDYGPERADRLFRGCLAELWGEMKAGEIRNPGAILNRKLDSVLSPVTGLGEYERIRQRREAKAAREYPENIHVPNF